MQMFQPDKERLKVAIIGTSGSGKTCFIAAMRWLGECGSNARFISEGANGDSKNYLDDLHKKVNAGEVPPGTPKEFKLEFSERYVLSEGKPPSQIDFSLRDFKGGDLSALDANSPWLQPSPPKSNVPHTSTMHCAVYEIQPRTIPLRQEPISPTPLRKV